MESQEPIQVAVESQEPIQVAAIHRHAFAIGHDEAEALRRLAVKWDGDLQEKETIRFAEVRGFQGVARIEGFDIPDYQEIRAEEVVSEHEVVMEREQLEKLLSLASQQKEIMNQLEGENLMYETLAEMAIETSKKAEDVLLGRC